MSGHCIFQCQKLSVFGRLMKTSHFHRAKRTCTMLTRCWSSHQSNDRHRSVEKGSGWFRGASDTLAAMLRNKARIFKPSKKDGWRRDQGGECSSSNLGWKRNKRKNSSIGWAELDGQQVERSPETMYLLSWVYRGSSNVSIWNGFYHRHLHQVRPLYMYTSGVLQRPH